MKDWKLKYYYKLIEFSGMILLALFGMIINSFPQYFKFLGNTDLTVFSIFILLAFHVATYALGESLKNKIFYTINRYVWVLFWLFTVFNSGNVNSQFLFLLIFPLLVSAVDLDPADVKSVGIVMIAALFIMMIMQPNLNVQMVVSHLVKILMFSVIAFFTYRMVKETLKQKYEKEEAKRKSDELLELDKVKTDFLTVAQHQLRTPLSGARWGLDSVIASISLPIEKMEILKDVYKKVQDAMNIVNEMLEAAENKVTKFNIKKESINVVGLINLILKELSYLLRQKNVTVNFQNKDIIGVSIDLKMFKIALSNVLDNAVRYNQDGIVDISVVPRAEEIEISIKDSGIGIESGDMPYVFDRFYRGRNAILVEPNESGIGLHISKRIIELHGGTIAIKNNEPKGIIVDIVIPRS